MFLYKLYSPSFIDISKERKGPLLSSSLKEIGYYGQGLCFLIQFESFSILFPYIPTTQTV